MSDRPVHPLAELYGHAPWLPHDEQTWRCAAHPEVAPFGPGISISYSAPGSTFQVANACIECVCIHDEEVAQRREWWRKNHAD